MSKKQNKLEKTKKGKKTPGNFSLIRGSLRLFFLDHSFFGSILAAKLRFLWDCYLKHSILVFRCHLSQVNIHVWQFHLLVEASCFDLSKALFDIQLYVFFFFARQLHVDLDDIVFVKNVCQWFSHLLQSFLGQTERSLGQRSTP